MKPIGKVTHYYDKIGVAIVELKDNLKVGDRIRIEKGDDFFEQTVDSLHKDYQSVSNARRGEVVGLKVKQQVKNDSLVLLLD